MSSKRPRIEPAGFTVAVAAIVDCRRMVKAGEKAAGIKVYPGAHSWELVHIRQDEPFPVRGRLGFYEVVEMGIDDCD